MRGEHQQHGGRGEPRPQRRPGRPRGARDETAQPVGVEARRVAVLRRGRGVEPHARQHAPAFVEHAHHARGGGRGQLGGVQSVPQRAQRDAPGRGAGRAAAFDGRRARRPGAADEQPPSAVSSAAPSANSWPQARQRNTAGSSTRSNAAALTRSSSGRTCSSDWANTSFWICCSSPIRTTTRSSRRIPFSPATFNAVSTTPSANAHSCILTQPSFNPS